MCGICGIMNARDEPVDRAVLERMRDRMVHRGPDDAGEFVEGPVGLAMRRLSIIDLKTGHQPVFNEDQSVAVVFNGEIFNYQELRADLARRGHRFATETDTEVIVHLYEELGVDCVKPLNGMFALALWDRTRRRLLLARDRLGIKPLYISRAPGTFLFASELKAILEHPAVSKTMDQEAIAEYLTYEYIPAPRTAFAGISKVPGGNRVIWEEGRFVGEPYWDVAFRTDPSLADESTCAEAVRSRLREAVRLQLRSDVPLGVLLSGGIDSSSVVALMHDLGTSVRTFSIGFSERDYNELDAACDVATRFGTEHHFLQLTAEDVKHLLPTLVGFLDEPLADASVIPTFLVSQLARRHVKVALSGDGGDETFGGYETYKAHQLTRIYRAAPRAVREILRLGAQKLPASSSHRGFGFRAKKFTSGARFSPAVANAVWWGAYTPEQRQQLVGTRLRGNAHSFEAVDRCERSFRGTDGLNRIFYQDLKLYLQDDLLVKVDRMSMANSLEVRVPFLDHTLVEFAATIPAGLKVRGLRLKHVLKRAMQTLLPAQILRRPKRGFDIPLGAWMRGPLREFVLDTLSEGPIREAGLIDATFVHRILDEHMSGRHDHRQLIWPLVVFEFWRQRYRPSLAAS